MGTSFFLAMLRVNEKMTEEDIRKMWAEVNKLSDRQLKEAAENRFSIDPESRTWRSKTIAEFINAIRAIIGPLTGHGTLATDIVKMTIDGKLYLAAGGKSMGDSLGESYEYILALDEYEIVKKVINAPVAEDGEEHKYRVRWEIDVNAISPKAAAVVALNIQRDPKSSATWFTVESDGGVVTNIDLDD